MITFPWFIIQLSSLHLHQHLLSTCSVQSPSTPLLLSVLRWWFNLEPTVCPGHLHSVCVLLLPSGTTHCLRTATTVSFASLEPPQTVGPAIKPEHPGHFPRPFSISFPTCSIVQLYIGDRYNWSLPHKDVLKIRGILFEWTLSINGCYD